MQDVETGREGEKKPYTCLSCVRKGRETTAKPSAIRSEGFSICQLCASEISMGVINKCRADTERVYRKAEGLVRQFVETVLGLFDPKTGDISAIWSGRATGGRGSYRNAEMRAKDALALAQLAVARPVCAVAQKAADRAIELLKQSQDPLAPKFIEVIVSTVDFAVSRLRSAGDLIGAGLDGNIKILQPKMLDLGARRRFWRAAGQAYRTVDKLPTSINELLAGDLGIADFEQVMEAAKAEEESAKVEAPVPDGQGEATAPVSEIEPPESKEVKEPVSAIRTTQSRKWVAAWIEEHGGFPSGWCGFGKAPKKRKRTVKLAGADADPRAVAEVLNGAVNGSEERATA